MGRPTNHKKRYKNSGRPTVMTEETIGKLEYAFTNSFTDEQACFYAGINPSSLYEYIKKNPEFSERKELLKQSPDLTAKQTVVRALQENSADAWKWLEKKDPVFKPSSKLEVDARIDLKDSSPVTEGFKKAMDSFHQTLKEELSKPREEE